MGLKDFLDLEDLFHPKIFYEGEGILGGEFDSNNTSRDYLLLNAKVEKGVNCYQSFLEEAYYKPLANLLNSNSLSHTFFPKIVLKVNEKEGKRTIRFAMSVFLYQQVLGLFFAEGAKQRFHEFIATVNTEEEWIPYIKQLLKEDRRIYSDVQQNRTKSPNYGSVYQLYLDYIRYSQSMMSFDAFLEGKINASTKLIVSSRYYPELFKKEVPIEELVSAFDYDTFCLVAARSVLDCCRTTEALSNLVDNSIRYVKLYLDAVERVRRENPGYDCTMKMIGSDGKECKIRIQNIQKEYEALLARHPEFSFIMMGEKETSALLRKEGIKEPAESFDFSKKDNFATLEAILKRLKEDRELAAEWDFIRKGSNESESGISHSFFYPTQALSEDEKIRRMIIGREYLESSDYVYKIYGIHKFEGYVGYIYPNGSVIFEKYYENIKTKKVASSSATYVMRLDNFMEMSKLSKTEIIRIIRRDSGANVKRIFHREDMERWKSDVYRVIAGNDYTEDVMNYINTLISRNDLKKSEVKS